MEKTVILEMMLKVVMVEKSNYKLKVNFILKCQQCQEICQRLG